MNKAQKRIVVITALVIVAMMLFPPFYYGKGENAGYGFLFIPPTKQGYYDDFVGKINIPILLIQFFVAAILGGALFFVFKSKDL